MGSAKAPRKVYRHSAEFKVKAVKLAAAASGRSGVTAARLDRALGRAFHCVAVRARLTVREARKGIAMGVVWTIIIGFVVGVIAKLIYPGKQGLGIIMTTLLGIGGSLLATYGGQALGWYQPGQGTGFLGALVGAMLILFLYGLLKKKAA